MKITDLPVGTGSEPSDLSQYVKKDELMQLFEEQVRAQGYLMIGSRWKLIQGNNSKDLYIQDNVLHGYYRLSKTHHKVRLDKCVTGNQGGGEGHHHH